MWIDVGFFIYLLIFFFWRKVLIHQWIDTSGRLYRLWLTYTLTVSSHVLGKNISADRNATNTTHSLLEAVKEEKMKNNDKRIQKTPNHEQQVTATEEPPWNSQ